MQNLALAIHIANTVTLGLVIEGLPAESCFIIYKVHPICYSQFRSVYQPFTAW